MNFSKSKRLFKKAQKFIPGGVNSPVRAFKAVGGTPLFMAKGEKSRIIDVSGNEFIDFVGSWGPHLFGHCPNFIKTAITEALNYSTSFGAPTELEVTFAQLISQFYPSAELVRTVNSGTEATMSAIRLARAYTQKDKIIKFEGCYHGHSDSFLIKAGSGSLTLGVPNSPGVTQAIAKDTLVAQFNDINSVKELFVKNKNEIACVIVEPVPANMGVVLPQNNFLQELKNICNENKALLIFDEVITGFRIAKGGASEIFGVTPDLVTFGKIIGGGLPVGAYAGKRHIMELVAPSGPVYQAGTLSGNPLAMTAGIATLKKIQKTPNLYKKLERAGAYLEQGFRENLKQIKKNFTINRIGSMLSLFFTEEPVYDYHSVMKSDTKLYAKYFHFMLREHIYLPPSQFEAMFISAVHTKEELNRTISANKKALRNIFK